MLVRSVPRSPFLPCSALWKFYIWRSVQLASVVSYKKTHPTKPSFPHLPHPPLSPLFTPVPSSRVPPLNIFLAQLPPPSASSSASSSSSYGGYLGAKRKKINTPRYKDMAFHTFSYKRSKEKKRSSSPPHPNPPRLLAFFLFVRSFVRTPRGYGYKGEEEQVLAPLAFGYRLLLLRTPPPGQHPFFPPVIFGRVPGSLLGGRCKCRHAGGFFCKSKKKKLGWKRYDSRGNKERGRRKSCLGPIFSFSNPLPHPPFC